jgi:hypothetical protein
VSWRERGHSNQYPGRCLCPVSFCNYKYFNIGLFLKSVLFYSFNVLNRNVLLMLKVFSLFMLQHKPVVFLPYANFTDSFCLGVIIRNKLKWLRAGFTACTMIQQILILPTIIKLCLITPSRCCKLRHWKYIPFKSRKCYVQNTHSCQSVCHSISATKPSVKFSWSLVW